MRWMHVSCTVSIGARISQWSRLSQRCTREGSCLQQGWPLVTRMRKRGRIKQSIVVEDWEGGTFRANRRPYMLTLTGSTCIRYRSLPTPPHPGLR